MKAHYCLPKFVTLSPFLKLAFHHDTNEHSRKASGPISSVCLLCSLQASHHEVFLQNTTVCACGGFLTLFFNYSSTEDTHGGMFFNSLPNWSSTLCEGSLFVFQIWSSVFLDLSWLVSLLPIVVFPCVTSPCSHVPDVLFQIHETAQQCLCL